MTTYTWEYGAAGSGLHFTITYNDADGTFTVTSLEGSFDLNALWFSDGDGNSDGYTLAKSDNSLNMNGSNEVWADDGTSSMEKITWDDYAKLSSPGLGAEGENKDSFIGDGETKEFTLADFGLPDFDPDTYSTLGVRATSVNGDGSIKWVDEEPEVQEDSNAPTDIRLTIDPSFAALVTGATGNPSAPENTTTGQAGEGGLLIGILAAVDADQVGGHTFEIVGENPGDRFFIDDNMLMLAEGKEIKEGDSSFQLTIKVTDSDGNVFYEQFNFVTGTSAADDLDGVDINTIMLDFGDGDVSVKIGDDIMFGFRQNDDLDGLGGDDAEFGGRGEDDAIGGTGDDQLFGGVNGDTLIGGPGADTMAGGHGDDTFVWLAGDLAGTNEDHDDGLSDVITDWNDGDSLDISDLLTDGDFAGATLQDAIDDGYVELTDNGGNAEVWVDLDGTAGGAHAPVLLVTLNGVDLTGNPTALDDGIVVV